jgi:hypothetical protein
LTLTPETRVATRVGEVVEARTAQFTAQCYRLDGAPPFGSLVRASDGRVDIYGLVYEVTSGSLDAGRRVSARGADEPNEDALFEHNPELAALLRTELAALVVGYREADRIVQRLPAHPPRLHGFVHRCDPAEVRAFGQRLDFLTALLAGGSGPTDELVAAALRQLAAVQGDERAYLVAAGKRLATLLGGDVKRLGAILRAAQA